MKTTLLCLACCCTLLVCFPQTRKSDLKNILTSGKPYVQRITACIAFNDSFGVQNFDEMLSTGKAGIELARANADSVSVGILERQIGEAYYFKGKYDLAADHFYTSVTLLEKADNRSKNLANSYNALAKLYRKSRDLSRAILNYDKAFNIFKQLSDSAGMAMIWNESGVVFEYGREYDKAIVRYMASLKMDEQLRDTVGIAYALSNLAGVYVLQKKYAEAESNLELALAIRKKLRDTFALALNYSDLASANLAGAEFEKARRNIDSSNALAVKMGYPELRQNNFDLLAQLAEKTGNYKLAYDYSNQKAVLKDSLFGIEKTKQIEELNTRYETVQKEQQIAEQQHRIEKQTTIFGAVAGIVMLLSLLAYTQYRRYRWKQEARLQTEVSKQQEEAARAVVEAEEAERQRIAKDLHDGVGQMMSAAKMNLSAFEESVRFSSQESKQSFEKIMQLVDESCHEVRSVSHNMMPNALLKHNLDAALREFINKIDGKSLKVRIYTQGIEERLPTHLETVLYRVIQECVNNVIKHAMASTLDITIIKEAQELTATIEDNGKGFKMAGSEKGEGIGLRNIRTRVDYLKGTVEFDSTPGKGTLVALHIPL